jgi:hypothetical protein
METEDLKELFCKFCNKKFLDETAFQFHEKWSHYAIRSTQYNASENLNSEFKTKTSEVELEKYNEHISTEAEDKEELPLKINDEEIETEIKKSQNSFNQESDISLLNEKIEKRKEEQKKESEYNLHYQKSQNSKEQETEYGYLNEEKIYNNHQHSNSDQAHQQTFNEEKLGIDQLSSCQTSGFLKIKSFLRERIQDYKLLSNGKTNCLIKKTLLKNKLESDQVSTSKTNYLPRTTLNEEELIWSNRSDDKDTSDQQLFNCNVCEKQLSRKSNLKRHIFDFHVKQERFQCKSCPKSYATIGCLKSHIRYCHEKLSSHECAICQKSFSRKMSLNRHTKAVHDKIKLFKCQFCENHFFQKSVLKIHTERRHKQSSDIHFK